MQIEYTKQGDYQFPNLTAGSQEEPLATGKYARMRENYLREHRRGTYTNLLTSGKLNSHLLEVQEQAQAQVEQIVSHMAKAEGVNEELKAKDPLRWTGLMNNLTQAAEEIVLKDLIYS